jgi:type II secretory pathway pseudopilin PulG
MIANSQMQHRSFPRSAWERDTTTLRVDSAAEWPRSGQSVRSHAERGNEVNGLSGSPLSALRSQPRRGITLTEVLIAMGILTVGLLGVAALFPVGGYYMQKAEIADAGAAVAQSALSDAVARGLLNPENWYIYEDNAVRTGISQTPAPPDSANRRFRFTRPLADMMRRQSAAISANPPPTVAAMRRIQCQEFGSCFVLDPMGVAGHAVAPIGSVANWVRYNYFTYPVPATGLVSHYGGHDNQQAWIPWTGYDPAVDIATWPIRRVTFARAGNSGTAPRQLTASAAGNLFSSKDDLALDLPDRADLPSVQRWDVQDLGGTSGVVPLARQWRGDYSWIITVAPSTMAAWDALADGGRGYDYNVSVVVFYKRPISRVDLFATTSNELTEAGTALWRQERAVRAKVVSAGLSGGELLLERPLNASGTPADGLAASPFDVLKVGEWIMLCGPHPASVDTNPRFVLQWYRVIAIDGEGQQLDAVGNPVYGSGWDGVERRHVSLRGPQWPWQPAENGPGDDTNLSNWLCVGIFPGAVAVHTRTMRLEGNSPWSAQ